MQHFEYSTEEKSNLDRKGTLNLNNQLINIENILPS
jgi:hypothetical protein